MKNSQEVKTVYFAGKVSNHGGYRGILLCNPRVMSLGNSVYSINGGKVIYGGPFAIADDHGTSHQYLPHGLADDTGGHSGVFGFVDGIDDDRYLFKNGWSIPPEDAVSRCVEQIQNSDAVHAYLDTISCYGTLSELGYASAFRKPIYIYYKENAQNWYKHFWFIFNLPGVVHCGPGNETSIHPDCITFQKSYKERYYEYLNSFQWKRLRKDKLHEAGGRCQLCNSSEQPLHVHHRTYDRVFHEELSDLIALCKPCHEKFHNIEVSI